MKKIIALVLLVAVTSMSFAQKNEIKAIEKALKSSNFANAKSAVSAAEALMGSMDNKTKAKFYFLKSQALYANGSGSDSDIDEAIVSLNDLKSLESSMGKLKYTEQANEFITSMFSSFVVKANNAFNNKDFKSAAKRFEKIYKVSPKDTVYLYNAAYSAVEGQDFDSALDHFIKLKELGYTGIKMNYYATDKETGEEVPFTDKSTRDFSVKTVKSHNNPRDEKSKSSRADIVKNIALIYVSKDQNEKALAAMADARAESPDDLNLLLSEANVHLKMGNRDKFKVLMEEASQMDPNNAELLFNLGVLSSEGGNMEQAVAYYEKTLAIDPNHVNTYNNLAFITLDGEAAIVEEMNGLGNSSADNKRYDELKEKRSQLYKTAIPYLEKSLSLLKDVDTMSNLMNLYSVIGETDKYKAMKAMKEEMEASTSGN